MWPFKRSEKRQSGGNFSDSVVRLLEAQAAGTAADVSSTAAVESASGLLSRALSIADVQGAPWAQKIITPDYLSQVGRDLIRNGQSLHVIRVIKGMVKLIPASSWHWEGDHDPANWTVRATCYGPSTSTTWNVPASSVIFLTWGTTPGQKYTGVGPLSWASTTARLNSESERSLADESAGPVSQIIPVPDDGGDGEENTDPLLALKKELAAARGKAVLVETTAAGYGEGKSAAPRKDWVANRLGPNFPDSMVNISKDSFARVLASCGCSPSLFDDSTGTSKREALRHFHLGTVLPLAGLLEAELSAKLETPVQLKFDLYSVDLAGRAQVFQKLVAGGVSVNEALVTTGLLNEDG